MAKRSGYAAEVSPEAEALDPVPLAWSWTPHNLVLVESHIGHRRHRVLQSWMLPPPAQGLFDFMTDELPPIRRAA